MKSLHQLRKKFKTQAEMASALGVTQPIVCEWLKGNKRISIKNAKLIEKKYGIPRSELRPDIFGDPQHGA